MTNRQMAIVVLFAPFCALYLAFAFILWQIDAGQWSATERGLFVWLAASFYAAIIYSIIKATKKKVG